VQDEVYQKKDWDEGDYHTWWSKDYQNEEKSSWTAV